MPHQAYSNISFLDKSFHEKNTRSYVLSAVLDESGLTAAVYDPGKNKVIGLHSQSFETPDKKEVSDRFEELLNKTPWLSLPFSKVCMAFGNKLSTLIPRPLFDEKNAALYLEFNHPLQTGSRVVFDSLSHTDTVVVYSLPTALIEKLKSTWPNLMLKHASTSLVESLAILVKNKGEDNTLFANVSNDSFELVCFRENKLHFYNRFPFNTKEDFMYFLLSAIEQMELNPETVKLYLMGKIDKSDAFYEIVYRYVRHIDFVERNDNFLYSYVLDEVKAHEHFVLFNSLPCE